MLYFKDGQETLDFLSQKGPGPHRQNGPPSFLLLDIRMPKVDGGEVLREVKAGKQLAAEVKRICPNIPVIFTTGFTGGALAERLADIGVSAIHPY